MKIDWYIFWLFYFMSLYVKSCEAFLWLVRSDIILGQIGQNPQRKAIRQNGKWLAVFQSSLPNVKQVNVSYEHETCKKFHVGLETTVFCFYPTRTPQVLGRSPAPSCGLSSPNRPIVMKESVLLKKHGTKQMEIHANDANSCFPLCPVKRN